MDQSSVMECSDLESVGTYDRNNEWETNIDPNEAEQYSAADDAETLHRQSFDASNTTPEVVNLKSIQKDLDEKLRLNQIRRQQLEEIVRSETATLVELQQISENIKRELEMMPEDEKLENERYRVVLSEIQQVRIREAELNELIEYIVIIYDENTKILSAIEETFVKQKRLTCQQYAAFNTIMEDWNSTNDKVVAKIEDKNERIKIATSKAQKHLNKFLSLRKEIDDLAEKIEMERATGDRLKELLHETHKFEDSAAAQLAELETREREEEESFRRKESEMELAKEEVDAQLKRVAEDLEIVKADIECKSYETKVRRKELEAKNEELETLMNEKAKLEHEMELKLSHSREVEIKFANLLEKRLKKEILSETARLNQLNSSLQVTKSVTAEVQNQIEEMRNDFLSMEQQLEAATDELQLLKLNYEKKRSEYENEIRSTVAQYEEIRSKKEILQNEGRLLCQEVSAIRSQKAKLVALRDARSAELLERQAFREELENKKRQIADEEEKLNCLVEEKNELLNHSREVEELLKTLSNVKKEYEDFEKTARETRENYLKEIREVAETKKNTSIQSFVDMGLRVQAEAVESKQKLQSARQSLKSIKKLLKKANDRNQHLSLEAAMFGAASEGLFQTITPATAGVTSTVQHVTSTVEIQESSSNDLSIDLDEFQKSRLKIKRSEPITQRPKKTV